MARAVVRLVAVILLHGLPAATVQAQTGSGTLLVDETFSGASVPDPNFAAHGITCLTGRPVGSSPAPGTANIPACPRNGAGPVPTPGVTPGYLQFTDAANNRAGNILFNRPIPSSAGLIAAFDQYQYGGTQADGISFFLVDGATQLTQTGGMGGSLAYAQHGNEPGIPGGYLGVGFDVFGNFYNDQENRGTGCPPQQRPPFPFARVPGAIDLRGPGNLTLGFCYLGSTTAGNPPVTTLPGSLRGDTLETAARRVQITITPAPTPRVIVTVDFNNGAGPQTVLDIAAPANPPVTYKFGWAGSTGAQNDVHLLRNVVVKTVNPLNRLDLVKQISLTQPLPHPIVVGSVIPYQFVLTNSGLEELTALQVHDPQVINATCPVSQIAPAPATGSTVVCTGSHVITQADLDAGQLVNTATATALDSASQPVTSNPSSVTLVLGTTARLTLQKFVDTPPPPPPYALGTAVAYRYDVTNTGNVTLQAPSVTDDKAAGITCDPPAVLAPGGGFGSSTTCHGTHVIQESDVDPQGFLTNTAVASAQPPTGPRVSSDPASLSIAVGTDIAVTKTVNMPTPMLGDIVTFTVTATNEGPAEATGLTIFDPITAAGIAFVAANPSGGTSYNHGTGVWTIGGLAVGASATLQLFVQVTAVARYTNVASLATLSQPDINPDNDTGEAVITPIQGADIAMAKTIDDATPAFGEQVIFTVTATNLGLNPATGVVVSDPLPAGLSFVSAAPSQGSYVSASGVWTVGALAPADAATLAITALVTQLGAFTNTATRTASTPPDPNPANDTASVSGTTGVVATADIAMSKRVTPATALVGDTVTFVARATNQGPNAGTGIVVTDLLPAGLALTAADPSQGTYDAAQGEWVVGALVNGATAELTLTALVTQPGAITNLATKTFANEPDPDTSNDAAAATVNAGAEADVGLQKTVDNAAPQVGATVTFTVTATNRGPSDATGVVVQDLLPSGLDFVAATPSQGTYDTATGTWTVGDLAVGATATLTLAATVETPATLVNNARTIAQGEPDPNPANNEASVTLNGALTADVAVTKAISAPEPPLDGMVTFTVTAKNLGPSDATGVVLNDPLPAGLSFVSATPSQGSYDAVSGDWTVGTLAPTKSAVLSITALVTEISPFTNTATRTAAVEPDPNPANDSGSATGTPQVVADLSMMKTDGLETAVVGQVVTYTLTVGNAGPTPVVGAVVSDVFSVFLHGVSWTCSADPGSACQSQSGSGDIAALVDLAAGGSAVFTASGAIGPNATGTLVNTARVDPPPGTLDPDPENNQATDETALTGGADLVILKTGPVRVLPGTRVTYGIVVANQGPATATSVTVVDPTPAGLVFTSNAGDCVTAFPCALGDLPPGASRVITATYMVLPDVGSLGTIVDVATVSSPIPDPFPVNNTSRTTALVVLGADLAVSKSAPATAVVGRDLTYSIRATNPGPSTATDVILTDPLPLGVDLVSVVASQGTCTGTTTVTCAVGTMVPGTNMTVTITVRPREAAVGTLKNTVTVHSGVPDFHLPDNTATAETLVVLSADLSLTKTVAPEPVAVGKPLTYTVRVTNQGPGAATGVTVTDPLPKAVVFSAATSTQGTCTLAGGTVTCMLGDLAVNATATVSIVATRSATAAFSNTAQVVAVESDPNASDNHATATTSAAGGEICNNCADDDDDGLVDYADPDCCTQIGTLTLKTVRVSQRRGNTKLRATGSLTGAGFDSIDPRRQEVALLMKDPTSTAACCTIAQDHWLRLFRERFGFWDQLARICPPIDDASLQQKKNGAGFSITSRNFDLTTLDQNPVTLTIRLGDSCATGSASLRRTKSGGAVFP